MPVTTSAVDSLTRRLPKVVSPKTHAIVDYLVIGSLFVAGALYWRRNRRAAIGALVCGGAGLAVNLATDYPGGIYPLLDFKDHGKIDIGLAAVAATIPEFLSFSQTPERRFFLIEEGAITAAANLTAFDPIGNH
jgi:hypothetical protein